MLQRVIDRTLDASLVVVLAVMATVVAVNVFCRFVLGFSIYWGDELALVLMVWLTFLGAAVGVREKSHYVFDFLISRLAGRVRRIAILTRDGVNLAAPILLGIYSGQVAVKIHFWILPAMEVSRSWVYAACPVGCVFMTFYSVMHLLKDWRHPVQSP